MKYLKQFGIIMVVSFVGEILNYVLPLPIPASIYGIVLMFVCLETKIIKLDAVKDTAKFLIEIMPIMFIPAAAGVIDAWGIIKPDLIPYIVVLIVSTVVVMAVSGRVTQRVIRIQNRVRKKVQADTENNVENDRESNIGNDTENNIENDTESNIGNVTESNIEIVPISNKTVEQDESNHSLKIKAGKEQV